jgi:hypothetical protein
MSNEVSDELIDFPDYPPLDETGMVDLWQIEANLAMTPAQRIEKFLRFLELQAAMKQAGRAHYANVHASDSETS